MQLKAWITFETRAERTEFIKLLNSSKTPQDAFYEILKNSPDLDPVLLKQALSNFNQEINKNANT